MSPQISLVIPVYNRRRYIGTAIESVLKQTFTDFELIVWDDGSSDDTVQIARRYAARDPRVTVVAAEHSGECGARRESVLRTKAPLLGWLDSDDLIEPTCLEETQRFLEANPSVGMVYTDYIVIDEHGNRKGPGRRCKIPYSKERMLVDFMTFHFRLMRREVYDRAGGIDPACPMATDYDLCLRISEITEIRHLPRPLYLYRVHPSQISYDSQVQQINDSHKAIVRALKRRDLTRHYAIDVEITGMFYLRRKTGSGGV